MTEKDRHDRIELRSERVRNLLGQEPPGIICHGTSVITVVFVVIAVAVIWCRYVMI